MTLDAADLTKILQHVSYRSGWTFKAEDVPYHGTRVRIVAHVEDAEEGGGYWTDLGIDSYVPPPSLADEGEFLQWLRWRLHVVEAHECDEFLRYRGKRLNDPGHAPATPSVHTGKWYRTCWCGQQIVLDEGLWEHVAQPDWRPGRPEHLDRPTPAEERDRIR